LKQLLLIILFSLIFLYSIDSFAEINNEILLLEKDAIEMINESKFDEALFYLDRILDIDPKNISALNNKGGILVELGNYTDSIILFNEVLVINENNTEALNNKAIALTKLGLFVQSLELFYKTLQLDPSNENAFNNTQTIVDNVPWLNLSDDIGVVIIKNHNGKLVGYSKISQINIQVPLGYIALRNSGITEEVEIDGIKHKVLNYNSTQLVNHNVYIARADVFLILGDFKIKVGELLLNGFVAITGDKIFYEVIILDPQF